MESENLNKLEEILKNPENKKVAAMTIDIAKLRTFSDALGHSKVLKLFENLNKRLTKLIRENDLICRNQGNFLIAYTNIQSQEDIQKLAKRVKSSFEDPFQIGDISISIDTSIGISVFPDDAENAEELLNHSNIAMHNERRYPSGLEYSFYSQDMGKKAKERFMLESYLSNALESNGFELFYQPQIDIVNKKLIGLEALLRWNHTQLGYISPEIFIPIAESNRKIIQIGNWVLEKAYEDLNLFQREGYKGNVSVNVSPIQFEETEFIEYLTYLKEKNHGKTLELEITETAAFKGNGVGKMMKYLSESLGIGFAIDDFGDGLSSIGRISKIPFKNLKLDKSLIDGIPDDERKSRIVKATIAFGNVYGTDMIIEGVETPKQLEFLRENGARIIQGYYFCKPVPANEMISYIHQKPFLNKI